MKSTKYFLLSSGEPRCSYCYKESEIFDRFDDNDQYCGTSYICDCEKAMIERERNKEIEKLEQEINKIIERYKDQLKIDKIKIAELQFKDQVRVYTLNSDE